MLRDNDASDVVIAQPNITDSYKRSEDDTLPSAVLYCPLRSATHVVRRRNVMRIVGAGWAVNSQRIDL